MTHRTRIVFAASTLALSSLAQAQTVAMPWWTIDAGAARSTSTTLSLTATIGQSDAGPALQAPSIYLVGGYWGVGTRSMGGCSADIDNGTGSGTRDGAVTIDDLLFFMGIFETGVLAADLDDGSMTGLPDGGVDISDLIFFMTRFESGC
jgi:hypothetical protein